LRPIRWLPLGALWALACTTPPADTGAVHSAPPRPRPAGAPPAPGAPLVSWRSKTHEQRIEYMALVVHPRMKALFRQYDPDRRIRCQTCHGEDMVRDRFAMPRALPALPRVGAFELTLTRSEKAARFMADRVVPEIRKLLGDDGEPAPEGQGCSTCHVVALPEPVLDAGAD